MVGILLAATLWESFPNLVIAAVAVIGAFATGYKLYQNYNQTKLQIAKETSFNAEKVKKIEDSLTKVEKDFEEMKRVVGELKNKQQIDYDYMSKIFDNLEKDFSYYRDFIISQIKRT